MERKRRHIAAEASCRRCAGRDESILHVLRDCGFAGRVLDLLVFQQSDALRTRGRVDQWLRLLLQHKRSTEAGIMCWYLWKSRNESIFNNVNLSPDVVAAKIKSWSSIVKAALLGEMRSGVAKMNRQEREIA
ncbi:hypothetical protein LINPERHAP2_LOCUS22747 [Linum perenne]